MLAAACSGAVDSVTVIVVTTLDLGEDVHTALRTAPASCLRIRLRGCWPRRSRAAQSGDAMISPSITVRMS